MTTNKQKIPILYVDDEQVNLYLFEVLLKSKFEIHKTLSAEEGLNVLRAHPEIRVAVTDWRMPKMDGLTFAGRVKEEFPQVTLMMLSAFTKSKEIDKAIKDGILHEYFNKPLDRDSFVMQIESLQL